MAIKITFFTGSRSDYGVIKDLLRTLDADSSFNVSVVPNGMHLLGSFGHTLLEIKNDGFRIEEILKTYNESNKEKVYDFTGSVNIIYNFLKKVKTDVIFVTGDRIEAYSAALAAHFLGIKIIHSGGGTLTLGAVDNIYRYNISNLADIHFTTSLNNYKRLKSLPNINKSSVHFVGTPAVDSILDYKKNPVSIYKSFPSLKEYFSLMTFHPVTRIDESVDLIMDFAISYILENKLGVLITYPNNDDGFEKIISIINKWQNHRDIIVQKNLGASKYYSALNDCSFIIGNSSSALIEAPYFNKLAINVGSRQDGRDKDTNVIDSPCNINDLKKILESGFKSGWPEFNAKKIYGDGGSSLEILKALKKKFGINDLEN